VFLGSGRSGARSGGHWLGRPDRLDARVSDLGALPPHGVDGGACAHKINPPRDLVQIPALGGCTRSTLARDLVHDEAAHHRQDRPWQQGRRAIT
jgi:hypothetical protein